MCTIFLGSLQEFPQRFGHGRLVRERPLRVIEGKCDSHQILAQAVMQVLADAPLLVGGGFENLALQFAPSGQIMHDSGKQPPTSAAPTNKPPRTRRLTPKPPSAPMPPTPWVSSNESSPRAMGRE
jgi:hypothetical protein